MGFLMPKLPKIRIEGARLSDLSVTSSAYGEAITLGFGTVRVSGNIIWGEKIREEKVTETSSAGGKGGGGQKTVNTTFFYFVNLAISFGEGPADKVLRMLGDGKSFFDIRVGEDQVFMDDLIFRFYPGDEDQLPDPLILADKGEDETPAYKGIVYIVLEDFPLEDFGNRIPNVTAEINFEQGQANEVTTTVGDDEATDQIPQKWDMHVDWNRGKLYGGNQNSDPDFWLEYDLATLSFVKEHDVRGMFTSPPIDAQGKEFFGIDQRTGYLVGVVGGGPLDHRNYVWDPRSDSLITEKNHNEGFELFDGPAPYAIFTLVSDVGEFSAVLNVGFVTVRVHSFPSLDFVREFLGPAPGVKHTSGPNNGGFLWFPQWVGVGSNGEAWGFWGSEDELRIMRYRIDPSGNVKETIAGTIHRTEISPTSIFRYGNGQMFPNYDLVTGALIFNIQMSDNINDNFVVKWTEESGLVWVSDITWTEEEFSVVRAYSRLAGDKWVFAPAVFSVTKVDLKTGAVELDFTIEPTLIGADFWDDRSDCLYQMENADIFQSLVTHCYTGQAPRATDLASIIERISIRAGLDPVLDIEASDGLPIVVDGFAIATNTDGAGGLEDLLEMHSISVVEYDGLVNFNIRGGAITATLNEDDMVLGKRQRGYQPYREEIEEEIDLPEKFIIGFQNRALDYQGDTRATQRVLTPDPTIFSEQTLELTAPVVMDVDTAKKISEIKLYEAWIEQFSYKAVMPFSFLGSAPGDPMTINFNSGLSIRVRLDRADIGADFTIKARFKSESAGQFVSTASSQSGESIDQGIKQAGKTKLFMISGPLLRDLDSTNRTVTRTYFMGAPLGLVTQDWNGMRLLQSIDNGASYAQFGVSLIAVPWGVARNAITDPVDWATYDLVNFLDINMTTGADQLETVTDLDLANGKNACVLFKPNGTHEYFQFRDVAPQGGTTYRLSTLIRGIRGTEAMGAGGHAAGNTFVFLDPGALQGSIQDLAAINVGRLYKPVTLGGLQEQTVSQSFIDRGRDLMPYAPEHPAAAINGSDIDWTWIRRTRVGGAMQDSIDVPLSEDSESYELDIFANQAATSALRTLASGSEAVTYDDADITTDFGSIPATIWIELYQLSAQVGRGFARRREVEVI